MEEKKRKNLEEKSVPRALNYEDILDGFAREEGKAPQSTGASRTDLDGLALAELLGGDTRDTASGVAASGHYDAIGASDYSELARQFEELDLSALTSGDTEEEAVKTAGPAAEDVEADLAGLTADMKLDDDELSLEDSAGYAALLDRLEAEGKREQAAAAPPEGPDSEPSSGEERAEPESVDWELLFEPEPAETPESPEPLAKTEVLSFVNLAEDRDASPSGPADGESAASPEPAKAESAGLDLNELFAGAAETAATQAAAPAVTPGKGAAPAPVQAAPTGVDFLGLTAAVPQENRAAGKSARRMEVLFEGVEMSFEDQTDEVTLAELLLAQGKKKESANIFQHVSQNKGTTFWVAKRLRSFAANAEKP